MDIEENKDLENKDKIKENNSYDLKIVKREIIKNLKFAVINANDSIDVAALLEVKGFPTIKM